MHLDFSKFPIATTVLVIANATIFAIGLLSHAQAVIIQHYGFVPDALFHNKIINNLATGNNEPPNSTSYPTQTTITGLLLYSLIRLFSSMFIHASIAHLGFNLLALVYLGVYAERSIGVSRYVLVYFMAGITGSSFSWHNCLLYPWYRSCYSNRGLGCNIRCLRNSNRRR